MDRYVALLRGINVGGKKLVSMAALREALTRLGLADVQTILQSGSAVFSGAPPSAELLEAHLLKALGLPIEAIIRSAVEIEKVVESNPFTAESTLYPSHVHVMFTKRSIEDFPVVDRYCTAGERISVGAGHLYLYYPEGMGRSKLTGAVLERQLAIRGTARNWNTVLRISDLISANDA